MAAKILSLKRNEYIVLLIAGVLFAGISVLIQYIYSLSEENYVNISTLFFTGVMLFAAMLLAFQGVGGSFNVAISMGSTRRTYLLSLIGSLFIKYGIILLAGFVMYQLNELLPGKEGVHLEKFYQPEIIITVIMLLMAIEMIIGTAVLKYGMAAYWVMWVLFMAVSIIFGKIGDAVESGEDSVFRRIGIGLTDFILNTQKAGLIGAGIGFSILLMAVSSVLLIRQDVKA